MCEYAELHYKDNFLRIDNFNRYDPGEYYDVEFNLVVCSDGFGGIAPCECRSEDLMRLVDELNELYEFRRNEVLLQDKGYGSRVEFDLQRTGQLCISGELYGEHRDQSLKFVFEADQTVLKSFVAQLRALLNEE